MSSMLLDVPAERSPPTAARWFGAMQSQDVASGHWSLGSRDTGLTQADVIDAFERAGLGLTPRDADTAVDALAPARCATWRRMHRSPARDRPDIRRRRGLGTQPSEDASRPSPRRVVVSVCAQPRTRVPSGLRGLVGLTLTDAKRAAVGNDGRLAPLSFAVEKLWATADLAERLRQGEGFGHEPVALPGFDEFIVGDKDRSVQVPEGAMDAIVPGGNGEFRATVVVDGLVVATWKRTLTSKKVTVEVEPLAPMTKAVHTKVDASFARCAAFLGRELVLRADRAGSRRGP